MKDWECGDASVLTAQKWPKDVPVGRWWIDFQAARAPSSPHRRPRTPVLRGRPDGTGFSSAGAPRPRKVRYVSFPADAENCTPLPCSSLPPLAFGHFPLTGGIGLSQPDPLTLGSGWGPITHSRPLCCRPAILPESANAPTEKAPGAHQLTSTMVNSAFLCLSVGEGLAPPESRRT